MANTPSLGLNQAQLADIVNRSKIGAQRSKNEMMRLGTTNPDAFKLHFSNQIQEAQQPSEFLGAGNKLAQNQNPDSDILSFAGKGLSKAGGNYYYYGDTDYSTDQGIQSLFNSQGYKPTSGSLTDELKQSGFNLPSFRDKTYYKDYDITTQSGLDSYLGTQGLYNRGNNSLYDIARIIPEAQGNMFKLGNNYYSNDKFNPANISVQNTVNYKDDLIKRWFDQITSSQITNPNYVDPNTQLPESGSAPNMGDGLFGPNLNSNIEPKSLQGYLYRGNEYTTQEAARAQAQQELDSILADSNLSRNAYIDFITGSSPGDYEFSKPMAMQQQTPFGPTMYTPDQKSTRGKLGWNYANETTTDPNIIRSLLGAQTVSYNGKTLGDIFEENVDPTTRQWNDFKQETKDKLLGKTTKTEWDKGYSYSGINPNLSNVYNLSNGKYFSPDLTGSSLQSMGDYARDDGWVTQNKLSGLGKLLGAASSFAGPIGAVAGAALSGWGSAARSNDGSVSTKINPISIYGAMIPSIAEGTGISQQLGSALGGQELSKMYGNLAIGAGTKIASGLASGQSLKDILTNMAISGVGNLGGSTLSDIFGGYTKDLLGNTDVSSDLTNTLSKSLGDVIGRVGSTGIKNLLSDNKFGRNMGSSAVSGALSGLGNLFTLNEKQPQKQPQPQRQRIKEV